MLIGYARTSTTEQVVGLEAQRRDLEAAGCTRIFSEQVSSVAQRAQLEAAVDYLRDGDVLIVTKLDRLARRLTSEVPGVVSVTYNITPKPPSTMEAV